MPAFQTPLVAGQKRSSTGSEDSFYAKKRKSYGQLDPANDDFNEIPIARDPTKHGEQFWMVQWRAPQYKKHKTWDGDGVLVLHGGKGTLYDMDSKLIASGKPSPDGATIGIFIQLGGKEMEVDRSVSREEFISGRVFSGGSDAPMTSSSYTNSSLVKKFVPLKPVSLNPNRPVEKNTSSNNSKSVDLQPVNLIQQESTTSRAPTPQVTYWSGNWRKPQQKKHKTWDGDCYVTHRDKKLVFITDDGKILGTTAWNGVPLAPGYQTIVSGKQVILEVQVPYSQVPRIIGSLPDDGPINEEYDAEAPRYNDEDLQEPTSARIVTVESNVGQDDAPNALGVTSDNGSVIKKFVNPMNFYGADKPKPKAKGPLHDPDADGAVVMKAPTKAHQNKFNSKGRDIVPVVVDPILARKLRPHQIEGVKFMYECVMGLRKHEGQGCILADEMGMGKTLQTITLVWTLLKQNPYASGHPVIGKVLIVCPVTLVSNWKKEFHKWLGKDRVGVFTGDKDKSAVKQFINSKIHHVLVIGYEKLRTVIEELKYCMPPIGLIICDEGHRLKSASNKTSTMFEALSTPRRIILSGTPIQNDLSEFHAMADFCSPGLLDEYSTFRRVYETPILKSRAPGCSRKEREIGEGRQAQLMAVAKSFVLRRDASTLKNYLPPKSEYVVFVKPTSLQKAMFAEILRPDVLNSLIGGSTARSLAMITMLTKLCNSPILLKASLEKRNEQATRDGSDDRCEGSAYEAALKLLPANAKLEDVGLSGKLSALSKLLQTVYNTTDEKFILVSHYTSTLNVIEAFCKMKRYTYLRLDGQTPVNKRQEYVDAFNKSPQKSNFIFLLSAKAGGVGLNLIGASRLCLVDSDWNPSHDLQSMARIHRDGQKRPVFIYRLLTAGTIDEKIYQRQVTKLGLSDSLMGVGATDGGGKSKSDSFTHKELRDLFTVHAHTPCHTHELLECPCANTPSNSSSQPRDDAYEESCDLDAECDTFEAKFMSASQVNPENMNRLDKTFAKQRKAELAALGEWTHINCLDTSAQEKVLDRILQDVLGVASAPGSNDETERAELCSGMDPDGVTKTMDKTPGGAITFLFEKASASAL